jgi:centrosomal protein CEP95
MKKEMRNKMETEIQRLQDQLVRDDDDAYFRQLDADRVIHNLQLAKYHVNVWYMY